MEVIGSEGNTTCEDSCIIDDELETVFAVEVTDFVGRAVEECSGGFAVQILGPRIDK